MTSKTGSCVPTALICVAMAMVGAVTARAQDEKVVMALPTLSLTFSAAYVAEGAGIYDQVGLKVQVANIPGVGAINSVISGSSDFAQTTAGAFTRAAARGQRMLAIANLIDRPMLEVVIRNDIAEAGKFDPKAPLGKRGAILRDRTIAVDAISSIVHGYLRIVAIRGGLDPERDIRVSPMQPTSMMPAFKTKAIDGFTMSQPWTLFPVLQEKLAVVVASSPGGDLPELVPFGYNLLVTRPEVCEKRRIICERMGKAMAMAIDFIHTRKAEAFEILRKRFGQLDPDLLRYSVDMITRATPRPPVVTRAGLENAETYNVEAHLMKPEEKLKAYDGLFTDAFVR